MIFVLCFLQAAFTFIQANEITQNTYFELIGRYPGLITPQGDALKGEIEIIVDKETIASIEKKTGRDVGAIARDKYWMWINDACKFPSGHYGVYGRIVNATLGVAGVAVMPIMPDGKIALNCNYRHATRTWEIELPRGGLNPGEDVEAGARRETMEETGMVVNQVHRLGEIPPDSGVTSTIVPIYYAEVVHRQNAQPEESEAIAEILTLSIDEIKQAFMDEFYVCRINGEDRRVAFRDPFLAYALLLYELKQQKR